MLISPFSILITLISSVSWGIFDGVRKHLISKLDHWTLLLYLSSFFTFIYFLWALITDSFVFVSSYLLYGLITVVLNFFANYFYIKAIKISDISSAVPFLAFTSLFTVFSAHFFLNENLNQMQLLGVVVLVLASFFVNYKADSNLLDLFRDNKGALLMILVSLFWALSAPFDKLAVAQTNVVSHSAMQSFFITIMNLVMVLLRSRDRLVSDLKIMPGVLSLGSLISALALALQFYAYTLMKVPIFESLKRAIAIATAFIISSLVFKEKISLIKIIATSFVILGAVLILVS